MIDCSHRIKPLMLRDIKTEALLVFIRTTLIKFFEDLANENINYVLGNEEENLLIESVLLELHSNLEKHVVSSNYIRTLTNYAQDNLALRKILKKEEPLIVYYDALVKQLEISLSQGSNWIPEQLVLCLLSEWIIEEENSIVLYPFLTKIDYLSVLNLYEQLSLRSKKENDVKHAVIINEMYRLGTKLILKLKDTKYKINTTRKSKSRKKRK